MMKSLSPIEQRLQALQLTLPPAPKPVGNYLPYRLTGNLLFLAGSICLRDGSMAYTGAVGDERTIAEGADAARLCAINQLAILQGALGSLDRVQQMVSLAGFVWAVPGFTDSPAVVNGASDLFVEVFGEQGRHSRTAVSVSGLPAGSTVELQSVWEVC
jgi:enamine deaminase RidA (YjgF/YER057c/UK114 family)